MGTSTHIGGELEPRGVDPYNATPTDDQHFPDGNGWSKLNGRYTAKGMWLYWEDGDITPNTWRGSMFTGLHSSIHPGAGGEVDYSIGKVPPA